MQIFSKTEKSNFVFESHFIYIKKGLTLKKIKIMDQPGIEPGTFGSRVHWSNHLAKKTRLRNKAELVE